MKMIKLALLGGAALAVTAAGAQADELSDLKAQLEGLQSRVAQLESQPAVAPPGASFVTFGEGTLNPMLLDERAQDRNGAKTNTISVVPTADAAPTTVVTWNGQIRAALSYIGEGAFIDENGSDTLDCPRLIDPQQTVCDSISQDDEWDIQTRARIWVTATTDTAVGEVGVYARVQGNASDFSANPATVNSYYGWWNFTPGWTFAGGYRGTLANVNHGQDEYIQFGTTIGLRGGDTEQLRLTYSSGPFEWNVAVEDYQPGDSFAGTANLNWSGDDISARIMGGVGDDTDNADPNGENADWIVGAGATFGLADIAVFSLGATMGEGWRTGSDNQFWQATAYVRFDMTDAAFVELSYGYADSDDLGSRQIVNGGVYYAPVDQLTIGLQADWSKLDFDDDNLANQIFGESDPDAVTASFVSWWSF